MSELFPNPCSIVRSHVVTITSIGTDTPPEFVNAAAPRWGGGWRGETRRFYTITSAAHSRPARAPPIRSRSLRRLVVVPNATDS